MGLITCNGEVIAVLAMGEGTAVINAGDGIVSPETVTS
jgi:hypothetical protein